MITTGQSQKRKDCSRGIKKSMLKIHIKMNLNTAKDSYVFVQNTQYEVYKKGKLSTSLVRWSLIQRVGSANHTGTSSLQAEIFAWY